MEVANVRENHVSAIVVHTLNPPKFESGIPNPKYESLNRQPD